MLHDARAEPVEHLDHGQIVGHRLGVLAIKASLSPKSRFSSTKSIPAFASKGSRHVRPSSMKRTPTIGAERDTMAFSKPCSRLKTEHCY